MPAMTAVRATPRSNPGMCLAPSGSAWWRRGFGASSSSSAARMPGSRCGRWRRAARRTAGSRRRSAPPSGSPTPGSRRDGAGLKGRRRLLEVLLADADRSGARRRRRTRRPRRARRDRCAATEPSSPLTISAKSSIRIMPRSTRSMISGTTSPLRLPARPFEHDVVDRAHLEHGFVRHRASLSVGSRASGGRGRSTSSDRGEVAAAAAARDSAVNRRSKESIHEHAGSDRLPGLGDRRAGACASSSRRPRST